MTEDRAPCAVPIDGLTREEYLALVSAEDVDDAIRHKTAQKVRAVLFGPAPPLVAITCPECGKVLVRVSRGAKVEVKCLKCRVWVTKEAA